MIKRQMCLFMSIHRAVNNDYYTSDKNNALSMGWTVGKFGIEMQIQDLS